MSPDPISTLRDTLFRWGVRADAGRDELAEANEALRQVRTLVEAARAVLEPLDPKLDDPKDIVLRRQRLRTALLPFGDWTETE
jgi:hypothetical protein